LLEAWRHLLDHCIVGAAVSYWTRKNTPPGPETSRAPLFPVCSHPPRLSSGHPRRVNISPFTRGASATEIDSPLQASWRQLQITRFRPLHDPSTAGKGRTTQNYDPEEQEKKFW